jgi:hypothetical protein
MQLHNIDGFSVGSPSLECFCMFSRPAATLCSLKERSQWLLPLLIAAACSVAVNFYVMHRIGLQRLISAAVQASAFDPKAVLQNALEHKTQILAVQGLSTFLGTFVTALVVAKVLWLILTVIGEELLFKRVLAVVAHVTMLIAVTRELMMALTATVMRDMDGFDLRNPLATNLGFFCQPNSQFVFRLLASLDILTLANIFLLALGLSKISNRLSLRKACVLVILPWGLYVAGYLLLPSLS